MKDGQPKIFKISDLTPDQMAEMSKRSQQMNMNAPQNYFYKANWTTGYWPGSGQDGKIDDAASLVGTYNLDSSYTGKVSMDVPSGVDFLPAIEINSPDLSQKPDLGNAVDLAWNSLGGSLGQVA